HGASHPRRRRRERHALTWRESGLKAILSHYNAPTLGQPEGYVQTTPGLFTDAGEVTNDQTAEFLVSYLEAFGALVDRYARVPASA
ncbi:hypothetical protein ACFOLB_14500, partial [Microbacterium aurantiacum]